MLMVDTLHIIPVGFDFERLIQPISQGGLEADRVILLRAEPGDESDSTAKLANRMLEKLHEDFSRVLGAEVEQHSLSDIYDYSFLYVFAFELFEKELQAGNEIHVNISSMPRTVAFAFATAADSLIIENPEYRGLLHTYYVSPNDYVILDLVDVLEDEKEFLERGLDEIERQDVEERIDKIEGVLEDVREGGVTSGAKEMDDGLPYVEFPTPPVTEVTEFQEELLDFVYENEPIKSISQTAKGVIRRYPDEFSDSFRSKVQYNIELLEENGYIGLQDKGNSHQVSLTKMGRLWVRTHYDTEPD